MKRELLVEHLPLQIDALRFVQEKFREEMEAQKMIDMVKALQVAATITSIQTLITNVQSALMCIQSQNKDHISIGIGASPAVKEKIDEFIGYLDDANVPCGSLKNLKSAFQEIITDIPNPELPIDR